VVSQELLDFINAELARGVQAADVAANLAIHGWASNDIRDAFGRIGFDTESANPPRIPSLSHRGVLLHGRLMLAVIGVCILVASGTTLAFLHAARAPAPHVKALISPAISPHIIHASLTLAPSLALAAPCSLTTTPGPFPTATEHPLSFYPFPHEAISYPATVPSPLHLPAQFLPVEISGEPADAPTLWTLKFRVTMPPCNAAHVLASHFGAQGWHVATNDLGSGEANLVISTDSASRSGIVTIDPDTDDSRQTRILLFFTF
jgi:hypothetical protein